MSLNIVRVKGKRDVQKPISAFQDRRQRPAKGHEGTAVKEEQTKPSPPNPVHLTLRGFYGIAAASTVIGVFVVLLLNMATPIEFILGNLNNLVDRDLHDLLVKVGQRMTGVLLLIFAVCVLLSAAIRQVLKPLSIYVKAVRSGKIPETEVLHKAQRRIINLPFLFVPINIGMWLLVPAAVFFSSFLAGQMDLHTGVVLSVRASMVGFISSAISSFWVESFSRRHFIPFLFPEGRIARLNGVARLSISKRIRLFYRLGSMVPMTILVVTLLTLQLEVKSSAMSAEAYGRGLLIFTLVLFLVSFFLAGVLNRLVARSIVAPIENVLAVIPRVQQGDYQSRIRVLGNDEIGVLGDAGNDLIRGLAEREKLRAAFGKYVTPEVRDEILSGRIPLDGEVKEVTVLFADLRGFTGLVETMPTRLLVKIINGYFEKMAEAIQSHHGLVLQFIGDEIEAVFGAPLPLEDHATWAVRASLAMRDQLRQYNEKLHLEGFPALRHGIGIHTGKALAANVGSPERLTYTLVGDTVNVASRLQELTKEREHDIIFSAETRNALSQAFLTKPLSEVKVRGKSQGVEIFGLIGS
jgi:adenylate cyclase